MKITVDLSTLIIGTIPLWVALFGGAWVLMRLLIFKPLDSISTDLKLLTSILNGMETRIKLLEHFNNNLECRRKHEFPRNRNESMGSVEARAKTSC